MNKKSQQEPKCLASICRKEGDSQMYDTFMAGKDLYSEIASKAFHKAYEECCEFDKDGNKNPPEFKERRARAKKILLATLYGMGVPTIAEDLEISIEEAQAIKDSVFKAFPAIGQFEERSLKMAKELGYVTTVCGRKRRLPELQLPEYEFSWEKGYEPEGDILDFDELEVEVPYSKQVFYTNKLKNARGWKSRDKVIEQAKKEHIQIFSNSGKIADATRQTVNSRIQGCLHGDVRVQTKECGIVKIKNCVGRTLNLWDGDEWTYGTVVSSGKKQKCILTFSNGQKIICSPNHKFLTINTRGNKHFKELQELKIKDRVVLNPNFVDSDYSYNSKWAHISLKAHNAKQRYIDVVEDKFKLGLFLGRLASDGSYRYNCIEGSSYIRQIIAEHEFDIIPELEFVGKVLGFRTDIKSYVRKGRNEKMAYMDASSVTMANEINMLDIKHSVHDNIFMDTKLLRGFISGFFDGDGGISGDHSVVLTFGTQCDFTELINDLQKALAFFGIASYQRHYKDSHRLYIRVYDVNKFCNLVGFINKNKQTKALNIHSSKDNHVFGQSVLLVKDIEFTEDYVDMYDVCNTKNGYFIADGLVTHNSSADTTKWAMIKIHANERLKELGFRLLIQIHDEVVAECPEENAKECSELLAKIMSESAEEILGMPIKCDTEVTEVWYGKEYEFTYEEEEDDD